MLISINDWPKGTIVNAPFGQSIVLFSKAIFWPKNTGQSTTSRRQIDASPATKWPNYCFPQLKSIGRKVHKPCSNVLAKV
jgi:hypothetical protein